MSQPQSPAGSITASEHKADEELVLALFSASTRFPRDWVYYRHAADTLRDLSFLAASGSNVGIDLERARAFAKQALDEAERRDAERRAK